MNAQSYLKRYPHARPSTVAYLLERDKKLAQLRSEISPRPKQYWVITALRSVAKAMRGKS